jgi:murein DD-endopeptidase MepM/ murein hydrolase activator NlpD
LPSKENFICKVDYILPFLERWTVVNGGVGKELSHSWGIPTQRYAYDFFILDNEGKSNTGNKKVLASYYCYGKSIIAPADGVVVNLNNKHNDSRVDGKKVYCDAWDIRGNFIVIKHNDKEYSSIAHIMQNSFMVNIGDKVRQGEIIAKCGNSGNTSEPHIHFQLQTGKSFFLSAGLPIAFSNISAKDKNNYRLADKRPCKNNLQKTEDKYYIGRGLEVENLTNMN